MRMVAALITALCISSDAGAQEDVLAELDATLLNIEIFRACAVEDPFAVEYHVSTAAGESTLPLTPRQRQRRRQLLDSTTTEILRKGGCKAWSEEELRRQRDFTRARIDSTQRHAPIQPPLGLQWGMTEPVAAAALNATFNVMPSTAGLPETVRAFDTTVVDQATTVYLFFDDRWGLVSAGMNIKPPSISDCEVSFRRVVEGIASRYPTIAPREVRENRSGGALHICDALAIGRATLGARWQAPRSGFSIDAFVGSSATVGLSYSSPEGAHLRALEKWVEARRTF